MNGAAITHAVKAAREFLTSHDALRADQKAQIEDGIRYPSSPKQSGALRRASMDLTRALAEMRRPG